MHSNRLLSSLRHKDYHRLIALFDVVDLSIGDTLVQPQSRFRYVYFPIDSVISQLVPVDSHENLEVAMIGNEGMLGTPLILGVPSSNLQGLVQGSGTALRMNAASFRRELEQTPALKQHLHRYIYVLQAHLALTAACISFHPIELRLARWLLMTHDRTGPGSIYLTHKFLAQMLGVRRVGITNAAQNLQRRKLLSYSRGEITILNRRGLEQASCSCYRTLREIYESVLG